LGENLLPLITPLVQALAQFAQAFGALPEPVQTFLVGATALAAALGGVASVITIIGPGLTAIAGAFAGLLPAIASIASALTGLLPILAGVFTGPVGWVALAVAAGAAIYAFRDQIGAAFKVVGGVLQKAAAGFKSVFIEPVMAGFKAVVTFVNTSFVTPINQAITGLVEKIGSTFKSVTDAITAPFKAAFTAVRGIVNQILNSIGSAIGSVVQAINNVIAGANQALARVQLPQIPFLPMPQIPRFAEGGVVSGPTLAMVGEGGEPEYIVPQSKASKFAANWMAGVRGAAAIPRFAEGGVVVPSSASVSIQTGPVTQMNGTNYVTTADLSRAVQASVNQTLDLLAGDSMVRRSIGIA
jgi:hypothetical protein